MGQERRDLITWLRSPAASLTVATVLPSVSASSACHALAKALEAAEGAAEEDHRKITPMQTMVVKPEIIDEWILLKELERKVIRLHARCRDEAGLATREERDVWNKAWGELNQMLSAIRAGRSKIE